MISQREVVKIGRVQILVFLSNLKLILEVEERRSVMIEDLEFLLLFFKILILFHYNLKWDYSQLIYNEFKST